MRAIQFSSVASWAVGPESVPLELFEIPELDARGETSTDLAIDLLAAAFSGNMPKRGLPPVCILVSDGRCHSHKRYEKSIEGLVSHPWGAKSIRISIGIGTDGNDYDVAELQKFVSHPEIGVLKADSPAQLLEYVRWASVSATSASSIGKSLTDADQVQHIEFFGSPPEAITSTDLF